MFTTVAPETRILGFKEWLFGEQLLANVAFALTRCVLKAFSWVAVQELKLSYHNMDI